MGGAQDHSPSGRAVPTIFYDRAVHRGLGGGGGGGRLKKTGPEAASWAPFGSARPGPVRPVIGAA